jgi:hypothetical protein
VDVVIDHTLFATVAVPILFDPSNNVIVSPVTPVPVIVGVLLLVEVGDIVLMIGAEGAVVSITRVCAADADDTTPPELVAFAVIV